MRNLIRALRGKPVELSEKQQEKMARAQARADAMSAEADAAGREAMREAAAFMAGSGAAGAAVGGDGGRAPAMPTELPTSIPSMKDLFKQSVEGFREVVGESFDDRAGIIDAGGADFHRPPPEAEPSEHEAIAAAERAARDAARAAYRAAEAPQLVFSRIPTTGNRAFQDVIAHLQACGLSARPDRVFGVYRVPDRLVTVAGEGRAYQEWEIVHAPHDPAPATDDVEVRALRREHHLVKRRPGDPAVLDEDLTGTLLARGGVGPEDCFGLSRLVTFRRSDQQGSTTWYAQVEAALALTRPSASLAAAHEQLAQEAPIDLPSTPALPFHLEILDWEAVAAWVAPDRWRPARSPSPLPHLPADPAELLAAYLDVVGVRSEDCFGAAITRSSDGGLGDLSAYGLGGLRSAPDRPCVDGEDRRRIHAAQHVVVAYRDSAAYREGRARWRAYQDEVLHARLDHLSGVRPPIEVEIHNRPSLWSEVFEFFNPLDPVQDIPGLWRLNAGTPTLGPYCGPAES